MNYGWRLRILQFYNYIFFKFEYLLTDTLRAVIINSNK